MSWLRRLARSIWVGTVVVVVPLAVALAILGIDHLSGLADERGSFVVGCAWSHTLPDDPIVHPRRPGASHMHDFYGNVTTNASSTRASMLDAPTTCRDPQDRAAVWSPTAYMNDRRIVPVRERTYYFGAGRRRVATVPADLKMLAGNGMATSPSDNPHVTWDCGGDSPRATHPYDCSPYRDVSADGLVARIDFPECWDGLHTDSADHVSHVAYRQGRRCPPSHPHRIPRIRVRVHYGIFDPCAGARPCSPDAMPPGGLAFRLSSGPYFTVHADFWNTWQQSALDDLVARCVNAAKACGGAMP
jgi:Domain of unknown function (DUF1996)